MNTVVRPWKDRWQVWKRVKKGGVFALERSGELETLNVPETACCAVPARLAVAVPLWVEGTDDSTVREIARLEIEMKGLAAGERLATDVELEILKHEEGRALVRVVVYPSEWPGGLGILKGGRYVPSPLLAAYSGDEVHLWREMDDLVAVVVWKDEVVCWETTHWPAEPAEVASWLRRLMIQLSEELKMHEPFPLKEWFGVFEEVPEMFRRVSHIGDEDREQGPAIKADIPGGHWLPGPIRIAKTEREKRQGLLRWAALVVAVTAGVAAVFLVMNLRVSWKIKETTREIARIEQEIEPWQAVAAQWMEVQAAVDEQFHPLEVLREAVAALPKSGVRLTVFQMTPERVVIEGEAENVQAATEFFRMIEGEAKSGLEWEMTPPALQPNNTARFAITGERHDK